MVVIAVNILVVEREHFKQNPKKRYFCDGNWTFAILYFLFVCFALLVDILYGLFSKERDDRPR